uniref:Uncharacterized protein n=1 Tax=Arundo donax TaxID=35708 RepID=A0A0A9EDC2_ARUDO
MNRVSPITPKHASLEGRRLRMQQIANSPGLSGRKATDRNRRAAPLFLSKDGVPTCSYSPPSVLAAPVLCWHTAESAQPATCG